MPIILAAALHHIVGEIWLCHLIVGVHNHLEWKRGQLKMDDLVSEWVDCGCDNPLHVFVFASLILNNYPGGRHWCSHFTDRDWEVPTEKLIYPVFTESGLKPRFPGSSLSVTSLIGQLLLVTGLWETLYGKFSLHLPTGKVLEHWRKLGSVGIPQPPYLEDIVPRAHVCDIHPLAINVMPVGVPAAYSHSLFPKVGTRVAPLQSCKEGDSFWDRTKHAARSFICFTSSVSSCLVHRLRTVRARILLWIQHHNKPHLWQRYDSFDSFDCSSANPCWTRNCGWKIPILLC